MMAGMKSAIVPAIKTRNFHLPLTEAIYRRLQEEAARLRIPATALAREAVEARLEELRRLNLHSALASYAERHAGTSADLDEPLEATGIETLNDKPRKPVRRKGRKP